VKRLSALRHWSICPLNPIANGTAPDAATQFKQLLKGHLGEEG
jgi:hypothetical protein